MSMTVIHQAQEKETGHANVLYPTRCTFYPLEAED